MNKFIFILKLLNYLPYSIKIIDGSSMTKYNVSEYILDQNCFNILSKLSSVDINSLSVKEAFDFISNLKSESQNILSKTTRKDIV